MNELEERLRKLFAEHLGVDSEKVTTDANVFDDLGADSLDRVELCLAVEEEFDVSIPDDELEKLNLFGEWVGFVEKAKVPTA